MEIHVSSSAVSDLEGIQEYYKNEGVPNVGNDLVSSIIVHIETLGIHPDIGRKVPEFDDEKIRELIHAPFRIVYLRSQAAVHVVRVWRSERLLVMPEPEI